MELKDLTKKNIKHKKITFDVNLVYYSPQLHIQVHINIDEVYF